MTEYNYLSVWEDYIKNNYFPTAIRNPRTIEFSEFRNIVYNDKDKATQFVKDMLAGDVFVLKNALDKEEAIKIKKELYTWGNTTDEQELQEDSSIPNHHIKETEVSRTKVKDGYDELAHSYLFYRWNKDTLKLYERITDVWDTIKIFNGLDVNEYKTNVPKDNIIDRIQVLHYSLNSGKISCHCDKARWQKTNIGFNLTQKGEDYDKGGAYFLNSDEKKVDMEQYIEVGDATIFLPSIFHGVDTPTSNKHKIDKSSSRGRWLLLAQTVQSKCLKDREISVSYENYKKDPIAVLKRYKRDYK
tara:strand:- start:184 stop:1086 length:903 start_codon:yes stop_codon:yes gene_type:complete